MKFEEDGITLGEGWRDELGDDLKDDKTLADIKDVPSAMKMLVSAQKMVGSDKVSLPGVDATDDDWNTFFTSIGRPAEEAGYGLSKPEDFPEELPFDAEFMKGFQAIAHKIGLLPAQAKKLFDWHNGVTKTTYGKGQTALDDMKTETEKGLREKWGDKYNENMKKSLAAVRAFVSPGDVEKFDKDGLGNIPWLVEAFSKIGDTISEDKLAISHVSDNTTTARAEIDRIMGDLKHPYHDKATPGHTEAVNKMQDLYKVIHPE
jgi:hypothetical protein